MSKLNIGKNVFAQPMPITLLGTQKDENPILWL